MNKNPSPEKGNFLLTNLLPEKAFMPARKGGLGREYLAGDFYLGVNNETML